MHILLWLEPLFSIRLKFLFYPFGVGYVGLLFQKEKKRKEKKRKERLKFLLQLIGAILRISRSTSIDLQCNEASLLWRGNVRRSILHVSLEFKRRSCLKIKFIARCPLCYIYCVEQE